MRKEVSIFSSASSSHLHPPPNIQNHACRHPSLPFTLTLVDASSSTPKQQSSIVL